MTAEHGRCRAEGLNTPDGLLFLHEHGQQCLCIYADTAKGGNLSSTLDRVPEVLGEPGVKLRLGIDTHSRVCYKAIGHSCGGTNEPTKNTGRYVCCCSCSGFLVFVLGLSLSVSAGYMLFF